MKTILVILTILLTGCASTGDTTSPFMHGLVSGLMSGAVQSASMPQPTNRQVRCNTRYGVDYLGNAISQTSCN